MGNSRRTALLAAAAVALALSISLVYANVFVYYPVTVNVNPASAPVYFASGSNAGKPDLGSGNTIAVLGRAVAEVAHRLAADYGHATSAGRIYFHGTALADTAAALMPLVALLSSAAAMALTAAAMWPRGEEAGQVYEYEVT